MARCGPGCDMGQSFYEQLSRLRKAHHFLQDETERLARCGSIEVEALQDEAEALLAAFSEAVHQLEARLAPGGRPS